MDGYDSYVTGRETCVVELRKDKHHVYDKIGLCVKVEVSHMMEMILDNWDKIDEDKRHAFAGYVRQADFEDQRIKFENRKPAEPEERDFKWR